MPFPPGQVATQPPSYVPKANSSQRLQPKARAVTQRDPIIGRDPKDDISQGRSLVNEIGLLKDEPKMPGPKVGKLFGIATTHLTAGVAIGAGRSWQESANNGSEGRLAGARRTDDRQRNSAVND